MIADWAENYVELLILETLEIIAFIEAANTSARSGGTSISLAKIN